MVRVRFLASLREATGTPEATIDSESADVREILKDLRRRYPGLSNVIDPDGRVRPGYLVFVDGVDYRLYEGGKPREIVILPVNHGGGVDVELIGWDKVEGLSEVVAERVRSDGFKPDVVIGILRGGVIPARIIADKLGVEDMGVMEVKLYKAVGIRGERPYLRQPLTLDIAGKKVLVVDDISDTGLTLQLAVEAVNLYLPLEVKTATLYIKPWTDFVPDYYGESTESWIVFPWERGEYSREAGENE